MASKTNLRKITRDADQNALGKPRIELGADQCNIVFEDDTVSINKEHYQKLQRLYDTHSKDLDAFAEALYAVARRYQTMIGPSLEGAGFHGAVPKHVFDVMAQDFQVRLAVIVLIVLFSADLFRLKYFGFNVDHMIFLVVSSFSGRL